MFYWLLKYVVLGPVLKCLFRPDVVGLEHVPLTGPVILACNHLSFSDSIFTPLIMRRKVTFVAKAEYFTGKGLKGWLMRQFFVHTGTIPVDRSGGKAARAALDTQLRVLRSGNIAGIYPEGTRSPDGRLYRGKTGVARLALESGAPVVPVALLNTDEIQPTGRLIPRSSGSASGSARPSTSPGTPASAGDRFVERAVTDEIMYELMTLSGREYVDVYAASLKTSVEAPRRRRPPSPARLPPPTPSASTPPPLGAPPPPATPVQAEGDDPGARPDRR